MGTLLPLAVIFFVQTPVRTSSFFSSLLFFVHSCPKSKALPHLSHRPTGAFFKILAKKIPNAPASRYADEIQA